MFGLIFFFIIFIILIEIIENYSRIEYSQAPIYQTKLIFIHRGLP